MIHSLTGTVLETPKNKIILDNGHNCSFSIFALDQDRVLGYSGRFYVHFHFRQDQMSLFGFKDEAICDVFKRLITVKGCGPKTAINILNHIQINSFIEAIHHKNDGLLMKIPGIGKKMAAQLILDLQNQFVASHNKQPSLINTVEVMGALLALGYSKGACDLAYESIDLKAVTKEEQLLKLMLSQLSPGGNLR